MTTIIGDGIADREMYWYEKIVLRILRFLGKLR